MSETSRKYVIEIRVLAEASRADDILKQLQQKFMAQEGSYRRLQAADVEATLAKCEKKDFNTLVFIRKMAALNVPLYAFELSLPSPKHS